MTTNEAIRQLARDMILEIDRFVIEAVSVDHLSSTLKVLLAAMAEAQADAEWIGELRSLRNEIEYVSAFWLESGREGLDADERRVALEAAQEMRAALAEV